MIIPDDRDPAVNGHEMWKGFYANTKKCRIFALTSFAGNVNKIRKAPTFWDIHVLEKMLFARVRKNMRIFASL